MTPAAQSPSRHRPAAPTKATSPKPGAGTYVLSLLLAINGCAMLVAGRPWYDTVPGVSATGPYNPHFVADIGVAFLAAAASLLLGAVTRNRLLALPAAFFLVGHGLVHAFSWISHGIPGSWPAALTDLVGVFLPAGLMLGIVWRSLRDLGRTGGLRAMAENS